jgi:plasmid stabilization system protein ParE
VSTPVRVLSSVYEDISGAYLYYENERQGLGERLLEIIDSVFENIADFPQIYPIMFDNVHRALLPKYPYAVYYTFESDQAIVVAIRNTKQDPENLQIRA